MLAAWPDRLPLWLDSHLVSWTATSVLIGKLWRFAISHENESWWLFSSPGFYLVSPAGWQFWCRVECFYNCWMHHIEKVHIVRIALFKSTDTSLHLPYPCKPTHFHMAEAVMQGDDLFIRSDSAILIKSSDLQLQQGIEAMTFQLVAALLPPEPQTPNIHTPMSRWTVLTLIPWFLSLH